MPHYFFNKVAEYSELARLAQNIGLAEEYCSKKNADWRGYPLEDSSLVVRVGYETFLGVQSLVIFTPELHTENRDILSVLRLYILLCEPTEITDIKQTPYDMATF